ncbi:MAG: hypothetical protein JWO03_3946 [Bacteroidetes bacterium]|nr:hypothetical protein [Bacteroidota bacterium]
MFFKSKEAQGDAVDIFHNGQVTQALQLGRTTAAASQPSVTDKLYTYTGKFTDAYRNEMIRQLKPYAADQSRLAEAERVALTENKERISKDLDGLQQEERRLTLDRDSLPAADYKVTKTWWIYAVCIVLCIGEAKLTASAFSYYEAYSNIYQILLLAVFSLIYYFVPKVILAVYTGTENLPQKNIIRLCLAAIAIGAFYVIALMRSNRLVNIGETTLKSVAVTNTHEIPVWYFIFINLLFIGIGVYLTSLLPSTDAKLNNMSARSLDTRLEAIRVEKDRLKSELDRIPDRLMSIEQRIVRQAGEAEAITLKFESLHRACISTYISENRRYRSDTTAVPCYDDPIPSLQ